MKNLLLAALFIIAPIQARADATSEDAAKSEATQAQLVAMVACDSSAHLAARFMGAFVGVALLEAMSDDASVHQLTEKAAADFLAAKTCSDLEASTKAFTAIATKLSGTDMEARAKAEQGKGEEDQLAAAILEMIAQAAKAPARQ